MNLESNITNVSSLPISTRPAVAVVATNGPSGNPAPAVVTPSNSDSGKEAQSRANFAANSEEVAAKLAEAAGGQTDLQFRVDESLGRVIVSVVDAKSGEVIRQMPSEEALRIARHLAEDRTGLLSDVA